MGAFTYILVAYDGSPHSEKALSKAADIARCSNAAVQIVCAYDKVPSYLGEPNMQHMIDRVVIEAREKVEAAAHRLREEGVTVSTNVLEGPAPEAILRVAENEPFDLIVLGSRGFGQFQGLLMGSVSDRVMHHAKIPVLIVR